jgi:hypothetical protein
MSSPVVGYRAADRIRVRDSRARGWLGVGRRVRNLVWRSECQHDTQGEQGMKWYGITG